MILGDFFEFIGVDVLKISLLFLVEFWERGFWKLGKGLEIIVCEIGWGILLVTFVWFILFSCVFFFKIDLFKFFLLFIFVIRILGWFLVRGGEIIELLLVIVIFVYFFMGREVGLIFCKVIVEFWKLGFWGFFLLSGIWGKEVLNEDVEVWVILNE